MKTRLAQVGLAAALIAAAFFLRGRGRLPATPEEAVNSLFDAASRGDDATYIRLTADPLRASLENTRSQLGAGAFRESLRRWATGLKGLAVMRAAGPAKPDGGLAAVDVDLVFADRNERQRINMVAQDEGWLVTGLDTAQPAQPSIPYGTPVFEVPPPSSKSPPGPVTDRPGDGSEPPE